MEFDLFQNLATGFGAAVSFSNLGFALLGVLLGTLIGVLPGIGPIPTIAMLLPITFGLEPLSSLIMLVTVVLLWKVRKIPEPAIVALAAVAGLVVYPLIKT